MKKTKNTVFLLLFSSQIAHTAEPTNDGYKDCVNRLYKYCIEIFEPLVEDCLKENEKYCAEKYPDKRDDGSVK